MQPSSVKARSPRGTSNPFQRHFQKGQKLITSDVMLVVCRNTLFIKSGVLWGVSLWFKSLFPPSLRPFQYSICNETLIELTNPGASGSIFYVTRDDEFIIKTVQHKEAEFLQKLLPGYYMVSPVEPLPLAESLLLTCPFITIHCTPCVQFNSTCVTYASVLLNTVCRVDCGVWDVCVHVATLNSSAWDFQSS